MFFSYPNHAITAINVCKIAFVWCNSWLITLKGQMTMNFKSLHKSYDISVHNSIKYKKSSSQTLKIYTLVDYKIKAQGSSKLMINSDICKVIDFFPLPHNMMDSLG